jgi:putative Mg2+ transporter-C (MgtC) family protein
MDFKMDFAFLAHLDYQTSILLKLLLAAFLGGLVGIEREIHGRPAGFRTHLLVTLGACLMSVVSEHYFIKFMDFDSSSALRLDPGRVAAQIVTGIGFLGAGVILKEGTSVHGLTTAACLWVAAGIGMAIGVGLYLPGMFVTLLSLLSLLVLKRLERFIKKDRYRTLTVTAAEGAVNRETLVDILKNHGLRLVDFSVDLDCEKQEVSFELVAVQQERIPGAELIDSIAALEQVKRVIFR